MARVSDEDVDNTANHGYWDHPFERDVALDLLDARKEIERLTRQREEARDVLRWHMSEVWDGSGVDGFEFQDELEKRGLLVRVEASEEFQNEYDTDYMYVWKWSDTALAALESEEG